MFTITTLLTFGCILMLARIFGFMPFGLTLLVPDEGEVQMLTNALTQYEDCYLELYKAAKTPAEADTVASYTLMTGQGYAHKTLTKGSWSVANVAGVTTASYALQAFVFTGGGPDTIYGYLVRGVTSNKLYWAEQITSQVVQNNGDTINITPKVTLE